MTLLAQVCYSSRPTRTVALGPNRCEMGTHVPKHLPNDFIEEAKKSHVNF